MKRSSLALATIGLTAGFVVAAGSGVAIGSGIKTVSSDGTISACVKADNGQVRVASSTADCKRAELPLTWQQGGAAGDGGGGPRVLGQASRLQPFALPIWSQPGVTTVASTSFDVAGATQLVQLVGEFSQSLEGRGVHCEGGSSEPQAQVRVDGQTINAIVGGTELINAYNSATGEYAQGYRYGLHMPFTLSAGQHTVEFVVRHGSCDGVAAEGDRGTATYEKVRFNVLDAGTF